MQDLQGSQDRRDRRTEGNPGESISTPEVTVSPGTQTVIENQTASFYCSASGNPEPLVNWRKVGGSLAKGRAEIKENGGRLEIRSVTFNIHVQQLVPWVTIAK